MKMREWIKRISDDLEHRASVGRLTPNEASMIFDSYNKIMRNGGVVTVEYDQEEVDNMEVVEFFEHCLNGTYKWPSKVVPIK